MTEALKKIAEERKTILCFGVDPVIEKMNTENTNVKENILSYFPEIIDKLIEENAIASIKPNYAFFARYGFGGLLSLKEIINKYKNKVQIIFDAKRGDIGKTSAAYADEAYEFWGADAVTVHPYMGSDSVKPFIKQGKTVYMLCRTSNPSAKEFEELECDGKTVYEHVAEKAVEWGTGIVVGATSDSIKKIVKITDGKNVPMLIPGIGAQGGDLDMVCESIKNDIAIHRINASSSIAYAYQKQGGPAPDAAVEEANKLNEIIRKYM